MSEGRRSFVLQHTRLQRLPLLPELQLHLADEMTLIWRAVQDELHEIDVQPPYWAFAWVGGQAVARYLLDHSEEVAGRGVVDFAAGSGLCAIAAKKAGAAEALAVDIAPFCQEAVALNARANRVHVSFAEATPDAGALAQAGSIPTGYPPALSLLDTDPGRLPSVPDIILAGDVCYEQPMASRTMAWLEKAHAGGIRVLIGDPGRTHFRREGLIKLADYQVPTTRDIEDGELKWAGVFTFSCAGMELASSPALASITHGPGPPPGVLVNGRAPGDEQTRGGDRTPRSMNSEG